MGTKAVLINTPKNTVQSDAHDWASIFNSIIGDVSGVLDYGKKLELKKINDNTVQLQDGVYSMQGHIIKVDKNTTQNLTITSGTLGMNRLDAVVVEYEKAADPKENDTFEFKVIRGTPVNEGGSSPVLPQLVKQDLLAGGSKRQELLYSVLVESTEIKELKNNSNEISNITSHSINLSDLSDSVEVLKNAGVTKMREITGKATGSNTTVAFPAGWEYATIISVEVTNVNFVWVRQNAIYSINSGDSFYFTHDSTLNGQNYRIRIAKTFNVY